MLDNNAKKKLEEILEGYNPPRDIKTVAKTIGYNTNYEQLRKDLSDWVNELKRDYRTNSEKGELIRNIEHLL